MHTPKRLKLKLVDLWSEDEKAKNERREERNTSEKRGRRGEEREKMREKGR